LTDGVLTRPQLARIAPDSVPDIARSIAHLIEVGLFVDKGESIAVHAWAAWNASTEEIEAISTGGKYGNHLRWHARRNTFDPACQFCLDHPDSLGESPPDVAPESKRQRQIRDRKETETLKPFEPDFVELYGVWRKKGDKAKALAAYQARRREGVSHEDLMRSARAYIEATKVKDPQLTKGLAVFLHGADGPWSEFLDVEVSTAAQSITLCGECGRASNQRCPEEGKPSCPRTERASAAKEDPSASAAEDGSPVQPLLIGGTAR
jgi:hypothetical protein